MTTVPLTHATGIGPLPDLVEERGGRKMMASVFSSAGLPLALVHERRQRIPMPLLARLYQSAADQLGDPLFGLTVGSAMRPGSYGMWVHYALQASTLGEGLRRAIRTLHLHQSGTAMSLVPRGDSLVAWEYWHPQIDTPLYRQHSDRLVPVMIRFVQAFLGPDWKPARVELAYGASQVTKDQEAMTGCVWMFGQPKMAIVMPASVLKMPGGRMAGSGPMSALIGYSDVVADMKREWFGSSVDYVAAMISLRLLDGNHDIDGAAIMLGMTPRTLQRRLEEAGLSYRSLLFRVRMQRAKSLILETDAPIKKISFDLGYSETAHFTRAFKKHFGFAPSRLRRPSVAD